MREDIILKYLLNLLRERAFDSRQLGTILRIEFGINYGKAKITIIPKLLYHTQVKRIGRRLVFYFNESQLKEYKLPLTEFEGVFYDTL